ncbi:YdbT family protein [Rubrobacter aplysinae]|uniref:hypothetical protein n=1 Tax=Rubrobacter aplysinae TaxID=909625 RepID=UPI00064BD73E|nr:hypothetical protein [Rubrobacter aplysinae]
MKGFMKRSLKLILPLVIVAEAALVWSGTMDFGDAVLSVAGMEAFVVLLCIGEVVLVVKRYRRERRSGLDVLQALESGASLVLPNVAARLITHEMRIFAALFKWAFRRAKLSEGEFSYHKRSLLRSMIPMLVFVLPVELFVIHLLVYLFSPWTWLGWALLGVEVYAFFWILGLYATLVTLPYRLDETGLRLRHGVFAEGFIPYEEIKNVARKMHMAPRAGDGVQYDPNGDSLYLATSGKTDLMLTLYTSGSVRGFIKESRPASRIHLAADEPGRLALEIDRRIGAPAAGPGIESRRRGG